MAGPSGIPGTSEQVATLFPIALVLMFAGPSVAGILLTGLVYGRAGLHEFLSRLLRWRVGARWYAVALLTIWVLATPILFALSLVSPVFLPALVTSADKASLLLSAISVGLVGGFIEELGWTGFAVPGLKPRYGVLATGLIVGFLWGAWHVPITFWSTGTWTLFVGPLFFYAAVLPAYRVLMVWVYDGSGSILVPMLMHASLIASTLYILLPPAQGAPLVAYYLVLAAALWVVALAIVAKFPATKSRSL